MTYDQYDNITKSSSNGTAPVWPQSGSYSSTTNQLSSSTYDANGSTLTDYFHTYQWDGFNRMSTIDSNTMTYDALGEVVEVANGSAYTVFEYTPIGSKIIWNESNQWTHGHLPMPGGTSLDWTPSATYIHHKDWLGSSRLTTAAGVVYTDKAFGAYGEDTAQDFGAATNFNYTGDFQDIETAVYDTPNREYMPYQGRWPSVDPVHSGWNAYAYAPNPISEVDPSGLKYCSYAPPGSRCGDPWGTAGGGSSGSFLSMSSYGFGVDDAFGIPSFNWTDNADVFSTVLGNTSVGVTSYGELTGFYTIGSDWYLGTYNNYLQYLMKWTRGRTKPNTQYKLKRVYDCFAPADGFRSSNYALEGPPGVDTSNATITEHLSNPDISAPNAQPDIGTFQDEIGTKGISATGGSLRYFTVTNNGQDLGLVPVQYQSDGPEYAVEGLWYNIDIGHLQNSRVFVNGSQADTILSEGSCQQH